MSIYFNTKEKQRKFCLHSMKFQTSIIVMFNFKLSLMLFFLKRQQHIIKKKIKLHT